MTAESLLSITQPESLFPGDEVAAKKLYRDLVKRWHPDRPIGNARVFSHISGLYEKRANLLANGQWLGPQNLHLGSHTIEVLRGHATTFGMGYVSPTHVWYAYQSEHAEFWERARRAPKLFKFAHENMKKEVLRYLPQITAEGFADDGRRFISVARTPELIRLKDAIEYLGGFEAKHSAWVLSGLMNLACYFSYSNVVHHNLCADTVFISPEHHSVVVLGGWEYVARRGDRITVVPVHTFGVMPFRARMLKVASTKTDLECIRQIGRELAKYDAPPRPIKDWLNRVNVEDAVTQYREWMEMLKQAYGPRRFIHLKLSAEDVYGRSQTGKV